MPPFVLATAKEKEGTLRREAREDDGKQSVICLRSFFPFPSSFLVQYSIFDIPFLFVLRASA